MGYVRHHAIVVTSWHQELLNQAHAKATELGMSVSNITAGVTNGHRSFLVAPDGSKEGWDESKRGDAQRAQLVEWLDDQRYDDDSTSIAWVEVQFGDERQHTLLIDDSDRRRRGRRIAKAPDPGARVKILVGAHRGRVATVNRVQDNGEIVIYFGDQDEDEWVYDPDEVTPV